MTIKHWYVLDNFLFLVVSTSSKLHLMQGRKPVGNWTIKVSQSDDSDDGLFLGWNMVLWGSAIDASKAKQYWEPVVDDVLPPSDVPSRPVLNDPDLTSTTNIPNQQIISQMITALPSLLNPVVKTQ